MKIPYAGQELSETHYEGGREGCRAGFRPKAKLIRQLFDLMENIPSRRRVLIVGALLGRCKREAANGR